MTLSELEELQAKLEELKKARGKVDEDERVSTMRSIRKRIRRLKKNIGSKSRKALSIAGDDQEDVPIEDTKTKRKVGVKSRKKKRQSKKAKRENKLVILSEEEKIEFLDQLTEFFKEVVAWQNPKILGEHIGYGYSGVLIIEEVERWAYSPEIMGQAILEKYKQRWNDEEPEWFTIRHQGEVPLFCFGPVPDTTNIW